MLFHILVSTQGSAVPLLKQFANRLRSKITSGFFSRKPISPPAQQGQPQHKSSDCPHGSMVFLGFDYRYTGNSRYLFEQLLNDPRFKDAPIRFITSDHGVPDHLRIEPSTDSIHAALSQASIVFAESWLPAHLYKHPKVIWVQLWHGIPLKRMLFDSPEKEITQFNPANKINKYASVLRWDYLLAGSEVGENRFSTSFLFPPERQLRASYPRVDYLLAHRNDAKKKSDIIQRLDIPLQYAGKKLVLYAPTWRDYNYGLPSNECDYDYVLDITRLSQSLGDEYLILFHDHSYIGSKLASLEGNCINVSSIEIQDLLLVANTLVTDYSSILFDALAIDLPFFIYAKDFDKFNESRGVYSDTWDDLRSLSADNFEDLVTLMTAGDNRATFATLKDKYSYFSGVKLTDLVYELDHFRMKRSW
jgi:CDP-glycerol glycerophosphotransferase (TagB/SpsB family)